MHYVGIVSSKYEILGTVEKKNCDFIMETNESLKSIVNSKESHNLVMDANGILDNIMNGNESLDFAS